MKLLHVILFILCLSLVAHAKETDNVVAQYDLCRYEITTNRDGSMGPVKIYCETTYLALEHNDQVTAYQLYGGSRSINKAAAPGASPLYRSYEEEDVFYTGTRVCILPVDLRKGKAAKVVFELTEENPEQFCRVALDKSVPTREAITEIIIPAALADKIRVLPSGLTPAMTVSRTAQNNGTVIFRVISLNQEAVSSDSSAPPGGMCAPQLFITGLFQSPQQLYEHVRGMLPDSATNVDDTVRALASQLVAKAGTPQALIDSTAAWVRANIRYYAIEHGDNAFVPATAAAVLARRSGDCKGSANLIKTLLEINGIDSHLVWIGTRGHCPFSWSEAPAIGVGNHMIAAAALGDSLIYIDGTARHAFDGYLSPWLRGQEAMIENGERCLLRRVPLAAPYPEQCRLNIDYSIAGDTLAGHADYSATGYIRVGLASLIGDLESRQRSHLFLGILAYGRRNADVADVKVENGRSLPMMTISGSVKEYGAVKAVGNRLYIDLNPLRDAGYELLNSRGRRSDYELPPEYESICEYRLAIPEGYGVLSLPDGCEVSCKWFDASITYSESEGCVICRARITTKFCTVALSDIEARNARLRCLRQAASNRIRLEKKQ